MERLGEVISRLADRDASRAEATVQADVRTLLLTAPFELEEHHLRTVDLESPVGDRRRIDVETGNTVIETKRDLRRGGVREDAVEQLRGYVEAREKETEQRYVGMLTDGAEWRCYRLTEEGLVETSTITVRKDRPDVDSLVVWLEGVLGTAQEIKPTPKEIGARLGAGSSSHALDQASLRDLYGRYKGVPSVQMKRELWARLLTTALGSHFEDTDELFVEHTLLVNAAEIIAHAVLGLDVRVLAPASLLSGGQFIDHGIYGVVEPDFFDWAVEVPGGETFIRTLARRLARFDWRAVEHDVLKVLYQSVIGAETRKKLGEYYTPDWLAEAMVEETISEPLSQRVLDPSCGSGTFLFHAVRRYLEAAEGHGRQVGEALESVSRHVLGMDLHPVAVTLARVTYILALGPERLGASDRPKIHVPVFLGDSMQWQTKRLELWTGGFLVIQVDGESLQLFSLELRFPESLLEDAERFDELVEELAAKATTRDPGSKVPSLQALFQRYGIPEALQGTIEATFKTLCDLHDDGRNHIWGYYVRNLARPVWLAQEGNRVDTLIGNPPWLAYRHMPRELQERFREMSEGRKLWQGAKVATHQDLSGLFLVRVIELYLERGGRFAFVMQNAALDRAQFAGFRTGEYPDPREPVYVKFSEPWDLRRIRPHIFPRGAGVVFGERVRHGEQGAMPGEAEAWKGSLGGDDSSWKAVQSGVRRDRQKLKPIEEEVESPWRKRFRQGASVVPRVLFLVEERSAGPLGLPSGSKVVASTRSAYEKPPWKELEDLEGVVESEFVHPLFLGEHVLPYRTLEPAKAVLPWERGGLLHDGSPRLDLYKGLAKWWREAEQVWLGNRQSERLTLRQQLDYHGKLSAQYPIAPSRIVYTKSGMHLCAARIEDRRAVVDHTLYWGSVTDVREARFLCAILNAASVTELVRPFMSYGKDERHIDKHIWRLPIPRFDPEIDLHAQLARLGKEMEEEIAALELDEEKNFIALRRQLRRHLKQSPKGREIDELVVELLS